MSVLVPWSFFFNAGLNDRVGVICRYATTRTDKQETLCGCTEISAITCKSVNAVNEIACVGQFIKRVGGTDD